MLAVLYFKLFLLCYTDIPHHRFWCADNRGRIFTLRGHFYTRICSDVYD